MKQGFKPCFFRFNFCRFEMNRYICNCQESAICSDNVHIEMIPR